MGNRGLSVIVIAFVLLTGCATHTSTIDWNTRIGSYSYDQALVDLGPPDKSLNLKDGTVVAEWHTTRRVSFGLGAGAPLSDYGSAVYSPVEEKMRVRELVFGPDGMLLLVGR